MSTIYLAFSPGGEASYTYPKLDWESMKINMLVSFHYLKDYRKRQKDIRPNLTMLDSGAFSAWNSGTTINLEDLTIESLTGHWDESVALDVVGDETQSRNNANYMREANCNVIPVFHIGESWNLLEYYCTFFKKVGLSCRFGEPRTESKNWLQDCFKKHWPFPFHSFGWVDRKILTEFPFHSADTSTWSTKPCVYGSWRAFPGTSRVSVKGMMTVEAEVRYWLKFERFLKCRWKKELSRWPQSI